MSSASKGIVLPGELVNIIFTVLIVMVIIMVFYFIASRFGGGQYCQSRFDGRIAELIHQAATTYGSSFTYTSLKVEDCIKDAYFKDSSNEYCYTYTEDGKLHCDKTVAFDYSSVSSINVGFRNCGSGSDAGNAKLQPGTYTVKITERSVCCRGC